MTSQHEVIGPAAIDRAFCACTQVAKSAFVFYGVWHMREENAEEIVARATPGVSIRLLTGWSVRSQGGNLTVLPGMGSSWNEGDATIS